MRIWGYCGVLTSVGLLAASAQAADRRAEQSKLTRRSRIFKFARLATRREAPPESMIGQCPQW